jgi:Phage T7 capsid assembly protein
MTGINVHAPEEGDGSPEGHQQEMIGKAEGDQPSTTETEQTPERPEWLPEKFSSVEDMAKSHSELERKLGERTGETDEEQNTEANSEGEESGDAAPEVKGMDTFAEEYMESGELSDESYKALEAQGIDRDTVDTYIEGQNALAQLRANEVFEMAGGEENYQDMLEWASTTYSAEEQAAFDSAIEGEAAGLQMAIRDLQSRYANENGNERSLLTGGREGNASQGYASWAEATTAMKAPQYKTDPAYRAAVEKKLASSSL